MEFVFVSLLTMMGTFCPLLSILAVFLLAVGGVVLFVLLILGILGFVLLSQRGKKPATPREAVAVGAERVSQVFKRGEGGLEALDDDDDDDDDEA